MYFIDYIFIIFFWGGLFFFHVGMKLANLSLFKFNIISFVLLAMIVNSYLGILPLYFHWDDVRFRQGVEDPEIILMMWFYSFSTIILMIVGCTIASQLVGLNLQNGNTSFLRPLRHSELYGVILYFIISLSVLCLYLSKIPNIAIFTLFTDGIDQAKLARSNMVNNFPGKFHWYKVFMKDLINVLTFSLYANYLIFRKRMHLLFFIIFLSISIFTSIMTTEKAPLIWLFIGLFLVNILVVHKGVYPVKTILKFAVFIIGILIVMYIYVMGVDNVQASLNALFSRAYAGSIMPAYFYIKAFPEYHDFLYGKSLPNPGGIFPYTPYRLAIEMHHWISPNSISKGVVGSAASVYWVEAYANFGTIGVIILPAFVGFILYVITYIISSLENTPLKVGFMVWVACHYNNLSVSFASKYIYDNYFFGVLVMYFSITVISNKGIIKLNSRVATK